MALTTFGSAFKAEQPAHGVRTPRLRPYRGVSVRVPRPDLRCSQATVV
jgi:hypothetical protein